MAPRRKKMVVTCEALVGDISGGRFKLIHFVRTRLSRLVAHTDANYDM
jgi:hypothetical protein